ncbi:transcriptional regulator, luxR family [Frankia sp. EI5c]|uniref:AAA family ATPase n=1 Tax=Frankia sp. EI5c TaxID=683316 RepID=UPI0007C40BD2|nr:AAA family ATPase [Frankia sp. EI5c]OAA19612.1 transcriptional regulator, luxR family [Frankia sp. EI5c]
MTIAALPIAETTVAHPGGIVRTTEYGRVMSVLDQAGSGHGTLVELSGDPGYGKTRLLTAVASEARRRGVDVIRGRCLETHRGRPFHPLIDAFSTWRPAGGEAGTQATAFIRALAAAGDMLAEAETGRCRLLAELRSLLADTLTAASGPHLLLLDDMHLVDRASVELLDILARWPVENPLSVVVAHRPRQAPTVLQATLQHCAEVGVVERVRLAPLSLRQSAELLGMPATAPELVDLHERGAGNPLYLTALAERAAADSGLPPSGGRAQTSGGGYYDAAGEPPDLWTRSALGARLLAEAAPLDQRQRLVAHAAAVLGDVFSVNAVAAVAQLGRDETCRTLGLLRGRDLVRTVPGGDLAFRHPLLSRCLYGETDPCWRAAAHRRAFEHLRSLFAPPGVLARHAEGSGSHGRPGDTAVLVAAAGAAVQGGRGPEAAHWLSAAMRLHRAGLDTDASTSTNAHAHAHAPTLAPVGPDVWRPVVDLLARHGDLPRLSALGPEILSTPGALGPAGHAEAAAHLAMVSASLGHRDHAMALLTAALAHTRGPAEEARLRVYLQLARIISGGIPAATEVIELAAAVPADDHLTRAGAFAVRALTATLTAGEAADGRWVNAAAAAFDTLGATGSDVAGAGAGAEPYYLQCLGWTEAMLGRYGSAHDRLTRALRATREHGEHHLLPALLNSLAYVHYQSGRMSEAIEIAREAHRASDLAGRADQAALAHAVATAAWAGLGRSPTFGPELPAGVHTDAPRTPLTALLFAEAALAVGDGTAVRALLGAEGETWRVAEPIPVLGARIYEALAAAARLTGQDPGPWANRAEQAAGQVALPEQRGFALLARGHALGPGPRADRCYLEAAELLATAPAGTRARELARLARRQLPRPAAAALGELTAREKEVAELAGDGLRTRDIARRLRVSPRTVDTHLAHIYDKLGVSSRVELARMLSTTD